MATFDRDAEVFAAGADQDISLGDLLELELLTREIALRTEIDAYLLAIQVDAIAAYRQACERTDKSVADVQSRLSASATSANRSPRNFSRSILKLKRLARNGPRCSVGIPETSGPRIRNA